MKRLMVVLVVLVVATGAMPAATARPEAFVSVEQIAEADWIVMDGRDHASLFFALGIRSVTRRGLRTVGVIGRGDCSVERSRYFTMITCQGSGRGRPLEMDEFTFDPALRSAAMTVKRRGGKDKIRWRGVGRAPWTSGQVMSGGGLVGAAAAMSRAARTTATLYGRRMPKPRGNRVMTFSSLSQGGFAMAAANGRNFSVAPDGSYTTRCA